MSICSAIQDARIRRLANMSEPMYDRAKIDARLRGMRKADGTFKKHLKHFSCERDLEAEATVENLFGHYEETIALGLAISE